jgi:hypothetical protein
MPSSGRCTSINAKEVLSGAVSRLGPLSPQVLSNAPLGVPRDVQQDACAILLSVDPESFHEIRFAFAADAAAVCIGRH